MLTTLHRYVLKDFVVTFLMTLMIFTFVLYIGAVIQAIDLMSKGVAGALILKIFGYNIPYILSFSIPISMLTSVLLLFSRLSLDGEITAMKASGQSLRQICSPIIFFAVFLSLACVYLNAVASPNSHFARRLLKSNIGIQDPVDLLEEGRFVRDFPGAQIYVGKKNGNRIYDVVIYELGAEGIQRNVRAESGIITKDEEAEEFVIDLYKVRIDDAADDSGEESFSYISADHYVEKLPYSELVKTGTVHKRKKDFLLSELLVGIHHVQAVFPELEEPELLEKNRTQLLIETHKRLAMSFCCLAFTMIGIPLGMKSRRKESSVGIAISLALVFVFYFFVIVAEALEGSPGVHPELLLWIPVFVMQGLGWHLISRLD